jgi:hypothetical protein
MSRCLQGSTLLSTHLFPQEGSNIVGVLKPVEELHQLILALCARRVDALDARHRLRATSRPPRRQRSRSAWGMGRASHLYLYEGKREMGTCPAALRRAELTSGEGRRLPKTGTQQSGEFDPLKEQTCTDDSNPGFNAYLRSRHSHMVCRGAQDRLIRFRVCHFSYT